MGLISGVTEDDVALLLPGEVPRGDQDHVALSDPVPLLHLAADPAHPLVAVLADHPHPGVAQVLVHHAEDVELVGHEHSPPDIALAFN